MALIKEYFELTTRYTLEYSERTVVIMQVGSFFEVYGLSNKDKTISGSQILAVSKICDLQVVEKSKCTMDMGSEGIMDIVMCGFKTDFIDKFIKKLQDSGFTSVVYVQDDSSGTMNRILLGIFSPGTFFSCDSATITNNTCCVWIEVKTPTIASLSLKKLDIATNVNNSILYLGASVIDICTGYTTMMEYQESYFCNPTTFDELERFLSIYVPSETIFISNLESGELDTVISYLNLKSKAVHYVSLVDQSNLNTERALNCEKQTYQTQLLTRFYEIEDLNSFLIPFYANPWATQSFCYLLDFIYQHNPSLVHHISEPTLDDNNNRLVLANHSLQQLNIIGDDTYKGKYSSVISMLNNCVTSMGKRKFDYIILNPIIDINYLNAEYNITDYLIKEMETTSIEEENVGSNHANNFYSRSIKPLLQSMHDITKINRQIILQKVSPKVIYNLYTTCMVSFQLKDILTSEIYIDYLKQRIPTYDSLSVQISQIMEYLNSVFKLEECKKLDSIQKMEACFFKPNVDAQLDSQLITLMDSMDQLEACRLFFHTLITQYETTDKKKSRATKGSSVSQMETEVNTMEYVRIHETEKNHFSLIATERRCKVIEEILKKQPSEIVLTYHSSYFGVSKSFNLKNNIEYVKQNSANKSITCIQINTLCKNINTMKTELMDTVSKVYFKTIKHLETFQSIIHNVASFITYVDLAYTKANLAIKYNYCKPVIQNGEDTDTPSFVDIKSLRHILIERIQQTELYVANDLKLGTGEPNGILLYGTNAVGKTSLVRSLGIAVIMAQSGFYVPAEQFIYKPYKYIFTRILGNDNLFKGLSTFAVEMSELRTILRFSNKHSLVLGDELCSGTESISAMSIFVAGIQAMHKSNSSFIFATHMHEIVNFDEITSLKTVALMHMSVIYDKANDCLIYDRKLKNGPGCNMYGLEVCKSLRLPTDFLESANIIRMKYHKESSGVLVGKQSSYNASNIKTLCEHCKINSAQETHHLIYQQEADKAGTIKKKGLLFNKNHAANLMNLCEQCHDIFHKKNKVFKKVKTTKGIKLMSIETDI